MPSSAVRAPLAPMDHPAIRHGLFWPAVPLLLIEGAAGTRAAAGAPGAADPASAAAFAATALLAAAALLLAGRIPGIAMLAAAAAAIAGLLILPLPPIALLPFLASTVVVGARGRRPHVLVAVGAVLLVPVLAFLLEPTPPIAVRSLIELVLLVGGVGAGEFARSRAARLAAVRAAAEERRRAAEEQERVRIARELHDVLAHSLSSITVQAGVGLHLAETRPEAAVEALRSIHEVSRGALGDVRAALGALRGDESAPTRPEPGLDALPALVAGTVGVAVTLSDGLQPRPPQPVAHALYRIVQESLTNAVRHAPGADVAVALGRDAGDATASIRDRRAAAAPARTTGSGGRGVVGMRERASLLGGAVELRQHPDGLEVLARIPVR